MSLVLYHHPLTRASTVVWMLEEVGCEYELEFVDLLSGVQKQPEFQKLNPMGKLPTLVDGETIVTEGAAIALYLGDRYALGRLAPTPDDPARGSYYRWSVYAQAVVEPGCMAKAAGWKYEPGRAGWGKYEEMLDTISAAIGEGPWLLGEQFSMADIVLGATVGWLMMVGMLDKRPEYEAYLQRLDARAAAKKAKQINNRIIEERNIQRD